MAVGYWNRKRDEDARRAAAYARTFFRAASEAARPLGPAQAAETWHEENRRRLGMSRVEYDAVVRRD